MSSEWVLQHFGVDWKLSQGNQKKWNKPFEKKMYKHLTDAESSRLWALALWMLLSLAPSVSIYTIWTEIYQMALFSKSLNLTHWVVWRVVHLKIKDSLCASLSNRKSYEFEDLLQSSTESSRVDWYAQSKLGLTCTLSEENVYEDIMGK